MIEYIITKLLIKQLLTTSILADNDEVDTASLLEYRADIFVYQTTCAGG